MQQEIRKTASINTSSRSKKLFSILLMLCVIGAVFFTGYKVGEREGITVALGSGNVLGRYGEAPEHLTNDVDFNLFWEVWDAIQQKYVARPLPDTQLFYGALSGLVAGVEDPYTVFLDPQTTTAFTNELSGSFEGIGAEIGIRDEQLVIIAPLKNTPAARAGVEAGSRIIEIDGIDTFGMTLEDAVFRIRGERGSVVELLLLPKNAEATVLVPVTRDEIIIESVTYEIIEQDHGVNVAHLQIINFNEDTVTAFGTAIERILTDGVERLIIDLRNNPGGFLDSAIAIADYWVSAGDPIVVEQFTNEKKKVHEAIATPVLQSSQTVVLINGGTASASEIVAGALQDHELATVVGTQSFGKGSVQEFQEFSDGSALKLTVAKWLTPTGRSIEDGGIVPDIIIESVNNFENDLFLNRALELLK